MVMRDFLSRLRGGTIYGGGPPGPTPMPFMTAGPRRQARPSLGDLPPELLIALIDRGAGNNNFVDGPLSSPMTTPFSGHPMAPSDMDILRDPPPEYMNPNWGDTSVLGLNPAGPGPSIMRSDEAFRTKAPMEYYTPGQMMRPDWWGFLGYPGLGGDSGRTRPF